MATLPDRLMSFIVERYPFALPAVQGALASCEAAGHATDHGSIEKLRPVLCRELTKQLGEITASDCRIRRRASKRPIACRPLATSSSGRATAF